MFLNQVKLKLTLPQLAYLANITTFYKGKNDKANFYNDKGVFTLTVLRMILVKLIYLEENKTKDENMSDSNAGARKIETVETTQFKKMVFYIQIKVSTT